MKFKLYSELLDEKNILSHVFLNSLPAELSSKIAKESEELLKTMDSEEFEKSREINMSLTIEGQEVDVSKFFKTLWDQYDEQVKEAATKLVKERTSEKLNEMEDAINGYVQIINEWANDINWDVPNPLTKK